jgi:hypothetical protein
MLYSKIILAAQWKQAYKWKVSFTLIVSQGKREKCSMEPGSKTCPPIVSCGVQNPGNKGVERGQAVYWYSIKPRIGRSGCVCTPDIKDMLVLFAWQGLKFLYFDIETCRVNKGPIITAVPNPWCSIQHLR